MCPFTLQRIEQALRASWAADTCSPDDAERTGWSADRPALGQCDITALLVHDLFGGALVLGEVHAAGVRQGYHWWNRLPSGIELDLTREQFVPGQTVTPGRLVARPAWPLPRRGSAYLRLRQRVAEHLGELPGPAR